MSLFGDSTPPRAAAPQDRPRSSLFDDEFASPSAGSGSLFEDTGPDPWAAGIPTPRTNRGAAADMVKTLLTHENSRLPDEYTDVYDALLKEYSVVGGGGNGVGLDAVRRVLDESGIEGNVFDRIWAVVVGRKDVVGREEVNVLLAMVGLAQEGDEVSIDGVDDRRRNLPIPVLKTLGNSRPAAPELLHSAIETPATSAASSTQSHLVPFLPQHSQSTSDLPTASTPVKPALQRQDSAPAGNTPIRTRSSGLFGNEDPTGVWGSPSIHASHDHPAPPPPPPPTTTTTTSITPNANNSNRSNGNRRSPLSSSPPPPKNVEIEERNHSALSSHSHYQDNKSQFYPPPSAQVEHEEQEEESEGEEGEDDADDDDDDEHERDDIHSALRNSGGGGGSRASSSSAWGVYDGTTNSHHNPFAVEQYNPGFAEPQHPSIGRVGSFGGLGGNAINGNGRRGTVGDIQGSIHEARGGIRGPEEVVTVTVLPEKEGVFMFQHRNYQIASTRRGSRVVRRYSDFVWLLDCLHKRYPFRQLPLLPPKRLAADAAFLERRRRGLARFSNALVRHPVLSQEQLVIMFLTVPTELSVWRKQATISIKEEFAGRELPLGLEESLPTDLGQTFDTVRSGLRKSSELYIHLCNLLERIEKRNEGIAADYQRAAVALRSLTDVSEATYAVDTNEIPLLNDGLTAVAKHLSQSQTLLEDEAKAWDEGVLEDLKRQRDCLVSMRELFERKERYAVDNIPQLEKRIQANERKLVVLRNKPDTLKKPGEVEKVVESIAKDMQSIKEQHARGVLIRECVRDELTYFQNSQYHVSRLHQDWSQERIKYAELQADNWRALSNEVEAMPLGD